MGFKHTTPVFKRCAIPCSHLKETYRQGKRRKANKGRKEKEESEHTKIDRRGRKYEKKKKKKPVNEHRFSFLWLSQIFECADSN